MTLAPARSLRSSRPTPEALHRELLAARDRVDAALDERLVGLELPGLSPAVEYQLASGGKRLRPALGLWLADRLGADADTALPFALAVELFHNVFLVHDDMEDGDRTRRGRDALWARVGSDLALNASDWMLARAYALIDETPGSEVLRAALTRAATRTLLTTAEGQALDLSSRALPTLDVDAYLRIAEKKTGRYFALAWVGAALVSGWTLDECEALWDSGRGLGAAFQVCDDLIDLTPGKGRDAAGCDVREGKATVLLAYALDADLTEVDRARLLGILAKPREQTHDEDVTWVTDLYRDTGAVAAAQRLSRRLTERGLAAFERLPRLPAGLGDEVRDLAGLLLKRRT